MQYIPNKSVSSDNKCIYNKLQYYYRKMNQIKF